MNRQLVYDLPTRIFHWLFASLFLTGFAIAKLVEDDSPWFNYHSMAGLVLGFLVLMRIGWGLTGSRHAQFRNFALNPADLVSYFKGILSGSKTRWAGHNPATSWAAVLMMSMALGLAVSGYLMTSGSDKETFEDVHELLANGFIVTVILHVAGIVLHTLRHKEMIGRSMVDGKKNDVPADQVIPSARSAAGVVLLGLVVVFVLQLVRNYDSQNGTLRFFGTTLQLGENEGEAGEERGLKGHEAPGDDDDDDKDEK